MSFTTNISALSSSAHRTNRFEPPVQPIRASSSINSRLWFSRFQFPVHSTRALSPVDYAFSSIDLAFSSANSSLQFRQLQLQSSGFEEEPEDPTLRSNPSLVHQQYSAMTNPSTSLIDCKVDSLAHILSEILDVKGTDPIPMALANDGITSLITLAILNDAHRAQLGYAHDATTTTPVMQTLSDNDQHLLRAMKAFYHWKSFELGYFALSTDDLTREAFECYVVSAYNPRKRIVHWCTTGLGSRNPNASSHGTVLSQASQSDTGPCFQGHHTNVLSAQETGEINWEPLDEDEDDDTVHTDTVEGDKDLPVSGEYPSPSNYLACKSKRTERPRVDTNSSFSKTAPMMSRMAPVWSHQRCHLKMTTLSMATSQRSQGSNLIATLTTPMILRAQGSHSAMAPITPAKTLVRCHHQCHLKMRLTILTALSFRPKTLVQTRRRCRPKKR